MEELGKETAKGKGKGKGVSDMSEQNYSPVDGCLISDRRAMTCCRLSSGPYTPKL